MPLNFQMVINVIALLTNTRSSTISGLSHAQATCIGVQKSSSWWLTLTPLSIRISAMKALSYRAHWRKEKKLKYNILTSYDKVYYKFWWVENSYANFGSVEVYLTWERMYSHFSTNLQEKSICKTSGEIESVSSGNKNKKEGADSIKRKIFQCFDPLHL